MPADPSTESEFPEIKLPESFTSDIPEYLLTDASEQDKFILHTLSEIRQKVDWACKTALDSNSQIRKTNGRLKRAEAKVEEHDEALIPVKEVLPTVQTMDKIYAVVFGSKLMTVLVGAGVGFILFVVYPYLLRYQYSDLLPALAKYFGGH